MGDGTVFIETIRNSEKDIMQRLFAGSEDPFKS
jgi:hypothetical protein